MKHWGYKLYSGGHDYDHELQGTFIHAKETIQTLTNFTDPAYYLCQKTHRPHSFGLFYGESPLNYSFDVILIEIVLIVFITRLLRFLLKPFRQPKFVSEMLSGIIVGPSVLCHSKVFCENVFPENSRFAIRNIGMIGFMYFLFVSGVEVDFILIKNVGKKHIYAAFLGSIVPFVATGVAGLILRSSMDRSIARLPAIGAVSAYFSVTLYPVLYIVLKELNLLSSEVGRFSVLAALLGDSFGLMSMTFFDAFKQSDHQEWYALWYIISLFILGGFLICCIRPLMFWIIERTPEGKPVNQTCVTFILLGVLVVGFFTDMFGIGIGTGALWFGLVIPSGPPLGATLVDRCNAIVSNLLMPFGFAFMGQYTDVFVMATYGWSRLFPLFVVIATGYVFKLASIYFAARHLEFPWRDSLALSMIMNLRGHVDLMVFLHWVDREIILLPMFTLMVLSITLCTGILTYFINLLYDPTKPYMVNKRRTIQHSIPGSELRLVVCIPGEESFSGLVNLLEVSYPTDTGPFIIYALRLIELVGRATPLFIDHKEQSNIDLTLHSDHIETIQNAFKQYEDARADYVEVNLFTTVTAKRSMYQDVCKLALEKKANLIVLPFNNKGLDSIAGTEINSRVYKMGSVNAEVIAHAPCSVALLVEKDQIANVVVSQTKSSTHNIVLLFMGGADAREALSYADRMAMNPEVTLLVLRFLTFNHEGDDEMEKKLDDGVMTWFWVKNEVNGRVFYREVVVKDGEETLAAIQALDQEAIDLWIVGRQEGVNPILLDGLTDWTLNPELGLVGDFLASADFGSTASVLVVHQQVMRGSVAVPN